MRNTCWRRWWSCFVVLAASGTGLAQAQHPPATVVVNGQTGKADVIRENGHSYVDVAGLAQIANGSLSFKGDTIILTLPALAGGAAAAEPPKAVDDTALSRSFMKAGIEEMALLREWGAAVGYVIQNGYPLQEQWAANYREQAANGLRSATVAATTAGDKSALQLLSNEFDGVRQWSDALVEASKNMATAKYSMAPGSLRDEPQSQKLIACWRFLGSMLGSGSFQDDNSCH
ncbi:MAG TPA: hypothetical protein VFB04_15090 [Terriglobales bacterium]|nr:hypothetical protein [Terriglobales bacterium]